MCNIFEMIATAATHFTNSQVIQFYLVVHHTIELLLLFLNHLKKYFADNLGQLPWLPFHLEDSNCDVCCLQVLMAETLYR